MKLRISIGGGLVLVSLWGGCWLFYLVGANSWASFPVFATGVIGYLAGMSIMLSELIRYDRNKLE